MEARQAWTIWPEMLDRRTRGSRNSVAEGPDASRRGTREDGKANAALPPLTTGDVGAGVTLAGVARGLAAAGATGELAAVDVACGLAAAGAARELAVLVELVAPAVSALPGADAGADAPTDLPLFWLLFWLFVPPALPASLPALLPPGLPPLLPFP
jgi:hypothetical protein